MIIPTRSEQMSTAFVTGVFCHIGLNMAYQDWKGLEAYVRLVEQNWWDLHWTVGAAIAIAAAARYYFVLSAYKKPIDLQVKL